MPVVPKQLVTMPSNDAMRQTGTPVACSLAGATLSTPRQASRGRPTYQSCWRARGIRSWGRKLDLRRCSALRNSQALVGTGHDCLNGLLWSLRTDVYGWLEL